MWNPAPSSSEFLPVFGLPGTSTPPYLTGFLEGSNRLLGALEGAGKSGSSSKKNGRIRPTLEDLSTPSQPNSQLKTSGRYRTPDPFKGARLERHLRISFALLGIKTSPLPTPGSSEQSQRKTRKVDVSLAVGTPPNPPQEVVHSKEQLGITEKEAAYVSYHAVDVPSRSGSEGATHDEASMVEAQRYLRCLDTETVWSLRRCEEMECLKREKRLLQDENHL
ncbi:hypothetical protein QYF36_025798 [Acer negundo]|nr:hypothetical protein QYF36_025798 [Acer negundo]